MSTRSHKADKIVQLSLILSTSGLGEKHTPRQQDYSHQGILRVQGRMEHTLILKSVTRKQHCPVMNELRVRNSSKHEAQRVRQESHPSDGSSASEGGGQECNYHSPQAHYRLQRGYFWRYFVLFMTKYH